MGLIVETITLLFHAVYLWIIAIIRAIVPGKILGHKDISGQTVLITGAGSGLGRLMSARFAEKNCRLVLWDINESGNEETAQLVKAKGAEVKAYTVDLSSREQIYQAAGKVKQEVGDVDILVNNAGIVTGKKFLDCPDALIEKTMDVNANAHFWTVKAFLPSMLDKNNGHIVSIASSAGMFGVSGLCDYCASKFAAVGFMESLRYELSVQKKNGIATTTVCPYYIDTGMFDGVSLKLLPILKPNLVVDRIMEAVLTNQALLMIPRLVYVTYMLRGILPMSILEALGNLFGLNESMDTFVGRSKKN